MYTRDRRCFKRWQINWQTKILLEGEQNFTNCTINDISLKGLKISLRERLEKDRFLRVTVVLSDEYILDVEIWVVWHKSFDGLNVYGFYFSKIKDFDKEKIYQFVRQSFPKLINRQWWQGIRKEGGEIMPEEKFEDRRIFERFTARFPLRFIDLKENKEGEASTENISAKGIGFLTTQPLQSRTSLEMWLQIPDKGEPLYTRGEVVWSKTIEPDKHRVGVNLEKANLMGLSRVLRVI